MNRFAPVRDLIFRGDGLINFSISAVMSACIVVTEKDKDEIIFLFKKILVHIGTPCAWISCQAVVKGNDVIASDTGIAEREFTGIVFIDPESDFVGVVSASVIICQTVAEKKNRKILFFILICIFGNLA